MYVRIALKIPNNFNCLDSLLAKRLVLYEEFGREQEKLSQQTGQDSHTMMCIPFIEFLVSRKKTTCRYWQKLRESSARKDICTFFINDRNEVQGVLQTYLHSYKLYYIQKGFKNNRVTLYKKALVIVRYVCISTT